MTPFSPRRLVSLWDLKEYLRFRFEDAHGRVLHWQEKLLRSAVSTDQKGTITAGERKGILGAIAESRHECEDLELSNSLHIISQIEDDLDHPNATPFYQQMGTQFRSLWNAMASDIADKRFVFIPKDNEQYFFNEELWPEGAHEAFPAARDDLNNSGFCLAADLHDAAVFHLMRVVEIGLRALARKLKVTIPKTQLDYAGWKAVVGRIEAHLDAKMPKARGAKQELALKFKHDLLADFKAFEVARNELMHGRGHYGPKEAIGMFERVRDFMQRLTAAISK
jgi:hypothetical protein